MGNNVRELGQMLAQPCQSMWLMKYLLRIRDRHGRMRSLAANAMQRAYEEKRAQQNIVLKARQMGVTTWVAGRFFLKTVLFPGTMTVQVAHTRHAAEAIFRIVHRMLEHMPDSWRDGRLREAKVSAGRIFFPEIDSEYRVWSAGDESAGRGLTIHNLHCSEVSRWPGDAAQVLAGLRAALVPDGELVLESTANGAYGAFYEEWQRAGNDGIRRHFFPWWMEEAYMGPRVAWAAMREDERELAERYGLREEQIGFRRGLERSYAGLRLQEFAEDAETCFRATGVCCFEVEAIESRMAELSDESGDPLERRRGGALCVWLRPIQGREYCVAVDTAGGGEEGDFAAVEVVDMKTGVQCAELQERLRPAELARVVAELAREYGEALVVVERNNHGSAVLAYLETSERYRNVYRERGEAGWLTTAASKPEMMARLGVLLRERPEMFRSRRLLGECRTFVSGERGKMGAVSGAHDDLVMAMGMAQAVRGELRSRDSRQ